MRRLIVHVALMGGSALLLGGCGIADSRSPVPEFMRAKVSAPPPEPAPPDVRQMVAGNLDAVFVNTSYPKKVRVSPPRRDGAGWTACVKAEVTSVNGKPLGEETYRITIGIGMILDRRRAEPDDNCASENYQPV
jgi:hypothetical protein